MLCWRAQAWPSELTGGAEIKIRISSRSKQQTTGLSACFQGVKHCASRLPYLLHFCSFAVSGTLCPVSAYQRLGGYMRETCSHTAIYACTVNAYCSGPCVSCPKLLHVTFYAFCRLEIDRFGGDLSRPLTVHWKTIDGTAKAGLDYIADEVFGSTYYIFSVLRCGRLWCRVYAPLLPTPQAIS
jgi:hypothetical protein